MNITQYYNVYTICEYVTHTSFRDVKPLWNNEISIVSLIIILNLYIRNNQSSEPSPWFIAFIKQTERMRIKDEGCVISVWMGSFLTFLQCSKRSILSRKHVVAGVLMLKSVVQRPSSDKCWGWYCWPASHSVAICGSHRGDAPYNEKNNISLDFKENVIFSTSKIFSLIF